MEYLISTLVTGVGATLATDAWTLLRRALWGTPLPDYTMVGRWIGHMTGGRLRHASIAQAARVPGERVIGWSAHYLIGVSFAAVLLHGAAGWMEKPTVLPALCVGAATVVFPWFVMQPSMTAAPQARAKQRAWRSRWQSLLTHLVFGLGLFVSGLLWRLFVAYY